MNAEKSSKKGLAILFVGVMIGIGVGIAACVTTMVRPQSATANEKPIAVAAKEPAKPLPSLYPPPAQTAQLTPNFQPPVAPDPLAADPLDSNPQASLYQQQALRQQQSMMQPVQGQNGMAVQSQDGSLLMPGVNAYATTTQSPGVTTYDTTPTTISAGNINPNWTIGRNGLLQNPCVDPPSAHGRATGQY